jgi:heme/copper-type cytochrome/quinol oxidase subunit 2
MAFLATQAADIAHPNTTVDVAFLLWATVLLVILMFGGGWFRSAVVRSAMNDETTQAHRRMAMACGFLITLAGAFIVALINFYRPVTLGEGLRLLITMAVAGTLLRFAGLEKRALTQ